MDKVKELASLTPEQLQRLVNLYDYINSDEFEIDALEDEFEVYHNNTGWLEDEQLERKHPPACRLPRGGGPLDRWRMCGTISVSNHVSNLHLSVLICKLFHPQHLQAARA